MSNNNLINFYSQIKQKKVHNPNEKIHGLSLPFRALINCASGGGKSNLMLNLLYVFHKTLHRIIIVSKAPEPLYDYLQEMTNKKNPGQLEVYYEGMVPEIEKMEEGDNGLIIFDDMVLTHNNKIGELFIRGRKLGYSCVYISQSFFGTVKIIRQNVNYVWLGRGMNKRDLRLILSEFSIGLSVDELENIYNELTRENMNFMMIDTNKRNIRQNIKEIIYKY
jgi:hypothetical protein